MAAIALLTCVPNLALAQGLEAVREGNAALDAGRLDAAAAQFARAAADPDVAGVAFFNLGIVRAKQGRNAEAGAAFERAAALARVDIERARAHYNRGVVLAGSGELREGLEEFMQALRLDPSNEDARTNFAITKARLKRSRPPGTPPTSPPSMDDIRRAMQQVPEQSYAFTRGKRLTRPVKLQKDW